jgi:hypothetical protein
MIAFFGLGNMGGTPWPPTWSGLAPWLRFSRGSRREPIVLTF